MIDFSCTCGFKTQAKDDLAGKKVKCPNCGLLVALPTTAVDQVLSPKQAVSMPAKKKYSLPLILAVAVILSGTVGGGLILVITKSTKHLETRPQGEELNSLKADNVELAEQVNQLSEENDRLAAASRGTGKTEPIPSTATVANVRIGPPLNKWEGFRGLKWGASIADAPGMVLTEDAGDNKYYRWEGDKLAIGEAELKRIGYGFYKGRFGFVVIQAEGFGKWVAIRDAVFTMYGDGYQPNEYIEEWWWGGPFPAGVKDVSMCLEHNEISEKTTLIMSYGPIKAEEAADNAKKAREATRDF